MVGGESEWVRAHEALSRLARERARADAEEGRWLLAALRSAAHVHLGFGSFGEYVERLFGYKPRSTQEKLRVAEALEALPATARALEQGALNWSAARELSRVAVAETEQEWLGVASGKTVHQLEALVAGKGPGDRPDAPSRPEAQRHVLRFEVAPETLAVFREAMNQLRRASGGPLDDDSALLLMARHVLGGPTDEGRASYQIALSVCPECHKGGQLANGELVAVGAETVAMADCDGQYLGLLAAPTANGNAATSEAGHAHESAHTGARREADTIDHASCAHTGARGRTDANRCRTAVRTRAHTGARARQTIPPAMRRAVLCRDHHCCVVPGCRNALFPDLHHIDLSSEGGPNDPDNLITLCGAHHRAAHRGELIVTGRVSTGLRFRHADGSGYGQALQPRQIETHAQAFAALRGLGFREGEIRGVLSELSETSDGRTANTEHLLRAALAKLTSSRQAG